MRLREVDNRDTRTVAVLPVLPSRQSLAERWIAHHLMPGQGSEWELICRDAAGERHYIIDRTEAMRDQACGLCIVEVV